MKKMVKNSVTFFFIIGVLFFLVIGGLFFFSGEFVKSSDSSSAETFSWRFADSSWSLRANLNKSVAELYSRRSRNLSFAEFVSDTFGRDDVREIALALSETAKREGLSERDIPYFVVSFVQGLPFTEDNVTTGFDEFPRFPVETLIAGGGDCEDSSILGAALLRELGYGVALLEFSDHIALGVACSENLTSKSFTASGVEYCFFETTGEGWDVGSIPEKYASETPRVIPIEK